MMDAAGTITYKYDTRGRQTEEKRTIDSVDYTTSFAYDGADRNSTITYPTGEEVEQTYNGRGLPDTLTGDAAGDLVTGTTYNALGLVTQLTLNNTLKTTFGYYGTGGTYDTTGGYYGRLWEIKTLPQAGGTALQDVRHSWDAVGNLATRQDVLTSETETFGYDFIDRLTGVTGPYAESFTYDETGNMTSKDGTAYTYGENGAGPHAVTTIGDNTYTYDSNGNMTSRPEAVGSLASGPTVTVHITATPVQAPVATATVHITATPVQATTTTYTWDVENRLIATSDGASFVYDGDSNRIKKTESVETILYINKYYEKNLTTGVVTTNYYLGSKLIATREDTTLTYVHQDALTGTSVTTNASGTSTGSIKYFSFGQARSGYVTTAQKFTGQRLDNTGLYYYGARYYDPNIGRFISADTIVPNPANPQSLNRYSYCLNNPLKYVDPTGHDQIITTGGVNSNGQTWYTISDGAGNLLAIATGIDDLAAKMSSCESSSRGVDLPVVKTTVDTTNPSTTLPVTKETDVSYNFTTIGGSAVGNVQGKITTTWNTNDTITISVSLSTQVTSSALGNAWANTIASVNIGDYSHDIRLDEPGGTYITTPYTNCRVGTKTLNGSRETALSVTLSTGASSGIDRPSCPSAGIIQPLPRTYVIVGEQ
jgi:RHS repeat-associated protein